MGQSKTSLFNKFIIYAATLALVLASGFGVTATAADYTISRPNSIHITDSDGTNQYVKVGTSATAGSQLIFNTVTGVLDVANSDDDLDKHASIGGSLQTEDSAAAFNGSHIIIYTNTGEVTFPYLTGEADKAVVELSLGVYEQTAAVGTNAVGLLSSAEIDDYAGRIYLPIRAELGGTLPVVADLTPDLTGATAPAKRSDNPFVLEIFCNDTATAEPDFALHDNVTIAQNKLVDNAGNNLSTNNPLTITDAGDLTTDVNEIVYKTDQTDISLTNGTANTVDLVRVTNTKAVFSGLVYDISMGGSKDSYLTAAAIKKDSSKVLLKVNDGSQDYAVATTVTFVDWNKVEISVAQGVTVSAYNDTTFVFDTTKQKKLYINTDGQFFLAPTTATYTTLTQILSLTGAQKVAASIDDGPTVAGTDDDDGIALANMKIDLLAAAFTNTTNSDCAAKADIAVADKAAPWFYNIESRITKQATANAGSPYVEYILAYATEKVVEAADDYDVILWVDKDADGKIDDLVGTGAAVTAADEVQELAGTNIAAIDDPNTDDTDTTVLALDVGALKIGPGLATRVRLKADTDRSNFMKDGSNNYYEPFLGDSANDLCRYYLFDDATVITAKSTTAGEIAFDYTTAWPDEVQVAAATFGAAVTDKAPAGIKTCQLVKAHASAGDTALIYIQLSEAATIGDYDGTSDAKLTSANELFEFNDVNEVAGATDAITANIYRMTAGKLNDIKTNGIVVGTNVESDLDGSAGTEFILELTPSEATKIETATDTLTIATWAGKILDGAAVKNSTLDTYKIVIGTAVSAPSKPVVDRAEYNAGTNYVDLYFNTDVDIIDRDQDANASSDLSIADAIKIYDGAGASYSVVITSVTVSAGGDKKLRLQWATSDELPVTTGLTVKYTPADTNNETDEYAVIGSAGDPGADYQLDSGFTVKTVQTAYSAKTADLNFDGYVDALIIDLDAKLDTSVTPAASGFSLETSEWRDYANAAKQTVIVKAGQTLNPSSVEIKNHYTAGKVDESYIVLKFDYAATTPFDWNPSLDGVQKPKTDAAGFVTINYSGTDVKTTAGSSVPAFYISGVTDGAAPAILSGTGSATNIVLDMSEDVPDTIFSGADNNEVSGFFVFKDANGYVMDTTDWDFAAHTALNGVVGSESNYKINIVTTAANVKAVKYVYISQEYASSTTPLTYTGEPIDDGAGTPNVSGKSVFNEDLGTTAEWQTYDSYTKVGTLVEISKVVYPTITAAQAFWNADGYYDQVLVCLSELVTVKNPLETANGAGNLENSWFISLDTDDKEDNNKEIHKLKVDKAEILTGGKKILLTISQGRQESSASGNDVHPVKVYYVDNSVKGTATVEYLVDSDVNYMRSGSAAISLGANQRTADPRSVEVSGTLKNFDNYQGATINAYEFYKFTKISETAEVTINFEYGPLAKLTKGAFGIQANGATDQCHQEGVYTGLHIVQAANAADNVVGQLDTTSWPDLATYIKKGYGYIHTDLDGATGDGKFNLVLSHRPDSTLGSVNPGGANVAASGVVTDSVFKVTFNVDRNGNVKVTGPYGITGKGKYTKTASEQWYRYNTASTTITGLKTDGGAVPVGSTFIPLNATSANYKVVAQDKIGALIDATANPTNAEKVILSQIGERKVVLTFTDCCSGTTTLLNGLTADVDINFYFYNYDGPVVFDPDRLAIFDYKQVTGAWNLLPIVVDKFYYTAAKAPNTVGIYPDKAQRDSTKVKVDAASTAIIGLNGGLPVVAAPNTMIFGLDKGGLVWAQAKAVNLLKGGYAYAIQQGSGFTGTSIYVFGYNVFPEQTAGVINMGGGEKLLKNVIDVEDPKDARSEGKLSNLGWNLMADIDDIDLATADNVDYVITFDNGVFDSWIDGGSLNDFTVITNDYNKRFSFSTSDEDVATGYKRGVGYFVHTEK